ncbi:MAG: DNA mismatch repair endonuclease MutH [Kangiellaceae bacterium]|jgi:DNA mismatch repair protein MutH|nr:DNA mismatch repair endonuclease MutH [Kangiellaceae bacterium]|tara:strand:+ start:21483 stop:22175 length:693 start_codon:yes stop_codon:yes gene_type:complete
MSIFPPKYSAQPRDKDELLERAYAIAGRSLQELADELALEVPENFLREKGWVGQLIEKQLGAEAGSKPEPDFQHLGIELKTLPVDIEGKPKESTFVCVAPLIGIQGLEWQLCGVKKKLSEVLWIPVESDKQIPVHHRRVGMPLLWQPSPSQEALLRQDWEEHIEKIALGQVEQITAHQGQVLQIRPKAANSKALTEAIGPDGNVFQTLPRGFYLRTGFTQQILNSYYVTQ